MITSVADLTAALRHSDLLEPREWEGAASSAPNAAALADELVRAGALTPFQARQLLDGHGDELVVGPFVLLDRLGAGGMGEVFQARHRLMERVVAVKFVHPDYTRDEGAVARFRQEVQALARLSHPNVVQAYHADRGPRGLFLVMEFCAGRDLGRVVADGGPLPVARACDCAAQAAAGLTAARAAELLHRDIKPSNLLVAADGTVKVLDFGLARFHRADADRLTRAGAPMGTPDFMSPEQARDSSAVDIRGDVYSLGCTLYFLLTGAVPFPDGTAVSKMLRHQTDTPTPVEELRPEVPVALADILRTMMAREPTDRYQTPAEVEKALEPFRTRGPLEVPPRASAAGTPFLPTTRPSPVGGSPPLPPQETPSEPVALPEPGEGTVAPRNRRAQQLALAVAGLGLVGAALLAWPSAETGPRDPVPLHTAPPGPSDPAPVSESGPSAEDRKRIEDARQNELRMKAILKGIENP